MRIGSRRSNAAVHHLANVATGEADVTQQVVVELQQVGISLPALGATEQGRDHAHWSCFLSGIWRRRQERGGLCWGAPEPHLNGALGFCEER